MKVKEHDISPADYKKLDEWCDMRQEEIDGFYGNITWMDHVLVAVYTSVVLPKRKGRG